MSSFAKPASATGVNWNDLEGRLLLVEPKSYETGIVTSLGEKDAVRADVTVLDGPDGGTENTDTLIFPRVLISQVRNQIGAKVLGRLGKGQAKPGQSAPWRLNEATDADIALGEKWLTRRASSSFAKPATEPVPAQAPAADDDMPAWA